MKVFLIDFESDVGTEKKSLGILGMKERALLLGGRFEIRGEPGKGTCVTVRIPLGSLETKGGGKA